MHPTTRRPPLGLISSNWREESGSGEPYLMFCTGKPNKLVLYLHTWSATYQQAASEPLLKSTLNDVCVISPNFSGPNNTPQALASDDAIARIKIAVNEVQYKTKLKRVYADGFWRHGGALRLMG